MVSTADHSRTGRPARAVGSTAAPAHETWANLRLNHRRFLDPNGDSNRESGKITARRPGHMIHLDVKESAVSPDGGGWRIHGRDSGQKRAADLAKSAIAV